MAAKLLLLLLGLAATLVGPAAASYEQYAPAANYDFNWAVNDGPSGNDYGHQESGQGGNTKGYYYVQLPDGRLQRVEYTVSGDSGFVAQVTYEGEAKYPNTGYGPSPSYGPPGYHR